MDSVNIGIIGIGFMGYTHFEGAKAIEGGRVAAIATRSEQRRNGDWNGIQGNFGPPAGQVDLTDVATYADYHDLLADPHIDLVDICLPTDLHERVALDAIEAGKAVLVEKPIAIDLEAADRMVEAAKAKGVPFMVAHVLPFFPEFRFITEAVTSKEYGELRGAHFKRVIAPPEWSAGMSDFAKLGGWGIDLHIHDNHFICQLAGTPEAVFSRGLVDQGFVNHVHSQYLYPSGVAISAVSGGICAKGLEFGHGFELYLDDATIVYDAGTYAGEWVMNRPLTVLDQDGTATEPDLPGGTEWCAAFTAELQAAVDGLKAGTVPDVLSGEMARDALRICHAEARSITERQQIAIS